MTLAEQLESDVEAVETELPINFIFEGKSYVGISTELIGKQDMQDAGTSFLPSFSMTVHVGQFVQEAPAENDPITVNNVAYRVDNVVDSPEGKIKIYRCVKDN